MIGASDLFVLREVELSRNNNTSRFVQEVAGKLGFKSHEVSAVLDEFEAGLSHFCTKVGDDNTRFFKAEFLSTQRIESILRNLNRAATSVRALNGLEEPALMWLTSEHMASLLGHSDSDAITEANGVGATTPIQKVKTFFDVLRSVDLNERELNNPKQIISGDKRKSPKAEYNDLSKDLLNVWARHDVPVGRSSKGYGAQALTEKLLRCFDVSVTLHQKYDRDGKPYGAYSPPTRGRILFQLTRDQLLENLAGPLDTAAKEFSRERQAAQARGRGGVR